MVLTWAFVGGAGDGNRTRTVSLGICAIRALMASDLRDGLSMSDRERPFLTGVNGTLMARRSSPDLRLEGLGLTSAGCRAPNRISSSGRSRPDRFKLVRLP